MFRGPLWLSLWQRVCYSERILNAQLPRPDNSYGARIAYAEQFAYPYARCGVRKTNLKTTMANPVNKTFCLRPNVGTEIFRANDRPAYEQTVHRNFGRLGLRPLNPNNIVREQFVLP